LNRVTRISPIGRFFSLGEFLTEKKSPKIHLNKAKLLLHKSVFNIFFSKKS
jgi:hypothetical protein